MSAVIIPGLKSTHTSRDWYALLRKARKKYHDLKDHKKGARDELVLLRLANGIYLYGAVERSDNLYTIRKARKKYRDLKRYKKGKRDEHDLLRLIEGIFLYERGDCSDNLYTILERIVS